MNNVEQVRHILHSVFFFLVLLKLHLIEKKISKLEKAFNK